MIGDKNNKEQWVELCKQAAHENDPNKLRVLIAEITRLLASKHERLTRSHAPSLERDPDT